MIKEPIYLKDIISVDMCNYAHMGFKMHCRALNQLHPGCLEEFGFDEKTWSLYCAPNTEALSEYIRPIIENAVGKKLWPTYSYGRVYGHNAELNRHVDRRSSEYTISLCVKKDIVPWNLVIETDNEPFSADIQLGDGVIYSGREYYHYREGPFKGTEQTQFFLQYVDQEGDSADLKWDTRPAMGLPFEFTQDWLREEFDQQLKGR